MNEPPSGAEEIGSDFEVVDPVLLGPATPVPWEDEQHVCVESGRQALAIAARHLRGQGIRRIAIARHHCESMVEPFVGAGIEADLIEVDSDLRMVKSAASEWTAAVGRGQALLHSPYFGSPREEELEDTLSSLENSHALTVVEDVTHEILRPWKPSSRLRVASLRKLLPIPDGGIIVAPDDVSLPNPSLGAVPTSGDLRLKAMELKSRFLQGTDDTARKPHLEAFAQAEEATNARVEPQVASRVTQGLLEVLRWDELRRRRLVNADALVRALRTGGIDSFLPYSLKEPAAFVVMKHPRAREIRSRLVADRIYCPIHWPKPGYVSGPWEESIFSIPVDHRYQPAHMQRVAGAIQDIVFSMGGTG